MPGNVDGRKSIEVIPSHDLMRVYLVFLCPIAWECGCKKLHIIESGFGEGLFGTF